MTDTLTRLRNALQGTYEVERQLGEGGMALVMLATDLKHRRKVAIKVLRPNLSEALGSERFLNEIETAAGLSHPHILPVHDSGEADGLLYYVMPLVEGESLRDRLDREDQLPVDDALQITREVAEALNHAHSLGVIHRDIKPGNIMLYGGHAVIADFGIAKAVSAAGGEKLTGTGIAVGTPSYMSPEQAAGDEVDARSDVYALACMLYEMLVGEAPFTGKNAQAVIQQHMVAPPPSASYSRSTVSQELSAAIKRGMAKTPADRFASANAFAEALTRPVGGLDATWATLVQRHVPHVLAAYVVLSLGIGWLLGVIVDRLVWSPHLPSFGLVAMASFIPAVLIVAYHRGGRGGFSGLEKFGVPANLVVSAVVLWLAFGSKDLGAATTTVVVEDEDGNTTERVVPKSEFRKHVMVFPFENETTDTTTNWMQYGLPIAMDVDLEQDPFTQFTPTDGLAEKFRQRGFPGGVGAPFALKRELAGEANQQFLVTGSFAVDGAATTVSLELYETRRGKLLAERSYTGDNVLTLADQLTAQLKLDLDIPTQHLEDTQDLPVADMLTESIEAYRYLVEAYRLVTYDQNWPEATAAVRRSTEIDPTNAFGHVLDYGVSLLGNDNANAARAIEAAMQHSYKLPENLQYQLKTQYYDFSQEADKALAVAEMRVELFPGDVQGRLVLAQLYSLRDRIPETMEQFEAILETDPSQHQYLQQLGALARGEGDFELAEDYYRRYADANPDDYQSYTQTASLQRLVGDFDEAKRTYERALLLEPNNVSVLVSLAGLERHFGNFEGGLAALEATVARARTTQDSITVFGALEFAYEYGGRMNEALSYLEARLALSRTVLPPLQVLGQQLGILDVYVDAGREDQARAMLASVEPQLQPPFDNLAALGHVTIALAVDDADAAEAALPRVQAFIDQLGVQAMQPAVTGARARILELRDRCEEAIPLFREELEDNPSDISVNTDIGRCQRKTGDLDVAEESLRTSLRSSPYSPTVHYQMALVFEARGDTATAVEHLETAMTVWGKADEVYKPAREAREELEALRGN